MFASINQEHIGRICGIIDKNADGLEARFSSSLNPEIFHREGITFYCVENKVTTKNANVDTKYEPVYLNP